MRIAFLVSYIGTNFYGSQQQPGLRTVEGEFIGACVDLGLFSDWRDAGFQFSGRTDAGVHARSQICAFNTDYPERAVSAINRKLPGDIRCRRWAGIPEGFNPRFEVSERVYRYFFPDENLDLSKMSLAAESLPGVHDFSRFARVEGKNPEKKIFSSELIPDKEGIIFEIRGESFLWNMVRCISHALWLVGCGSEPPDIISDALSNTGGPRFPAAPPEGLVLWDAVTNLEFAPMEGLEKSDKFLDDFRCRHHQLLKAAEFLRE